MKEFWTYTLMRLGLFAGTFAVVFGIWFLVTGDVPVFWVILLSFVISGVASYFLLERQRAEFAARVEDRAGRAAAKLEAQKAKEDAD